MAALIILTPLIQMTRRRPPCCASEKTVPWISVFRTLESGANAARFNAFISGSQPKTRPIVSNGEAGAETAVSSEKKQRRGNGNEVTYFFCALACYVPAFCQIGPRHVRTLPENALRTASKLLLLEAGDPLSQRLKITFGSRRNSTN